VRGCDLPDQREHEPNMGDAGPIDLEAVFERALGRVLDAFEPKG